MTESSPRLLWAYPTPSAKKAHAFPAKDEPSLCRKYWAGIPQLMEKADADAALCATCDKKAGRE